MSSNCSTPSATFFKHLSISPEERGANLQYMMGWGETGPHSQRQTHMQTWGWYSRSMLNNVCYSSSILKLSWIKTSSKKTIKHIWPRKACSHYLEVFFYQPWLPDYDVFFMPSSIERNKKHSSSSFVLNQLA